MKKKTAIILAACITVSMSVCACGASEEVQNVSDNEVITETVTEEAGTDTVDAAISLPDNEETKDPAGQDSTVNDTASDTDQTAIEKPMSEVDHEMTTDISGCDTFTQIVDKLENGKGYTNTTLGDTDVLLVTSGTYDNLDGNYAAIDAEVFMYEDGAPAYVGYIECGGTAYPLAVKDGKIYAGGNHFISKKTITDGSIVNVEEAWVIYDTDGNETYYYSSDDGGDYSDFDHAEAEKIFDDLMAEYMDAEILNFDTIAK